MRQLSLLRHATAAASPAGGNDFDRSLTEAGLAEAAALGRRLFSQSSGDVHVIASPALRTRQTADALAAELSAPRERISFDPRLYLAESEEILRVIGEAPAAISHLVIVGHNPGLSQLASRLARSAGPMEFEPASGCTMVFEAAGWDDATPGTLRHVRRESGPVGLALL